MSCSLSLFEWNYEKHPRVKSFTRDASGAMKLVAAHRQAAKLRQTLRQTLRQEMKSL